MNTQKVKKTCFVIGPIGSANSETRRDADFLLNGIIRPAIESPLDLRLWRADEDNRPGMITDKLISDIHDSDLVIADLTELNPNAFYELGIRHATAKPTVHMASVGTKLPFDNLGHRAIFFDKSDWSSIEAVKKQLYEQARQSLEDEFKVTNPITQALNVQAFNASASNSPSDQVVKTLLERVKSLEKRANPYQEQFLSESEIIQERKQHLTDLTTDLMMMPNLKVDKLSSVETIKQYSKNDTLYRGFIKRFNKGDFEVLVDEINSNIPF